MNTYVDHQELRGIMEKTKIDIEKTAELFKLLGERSRLAMTAMMNERECCVCDFTECFGMSQPAVSHHLRKLKDFGLVNERRDGYWTFLSLNRESEFYDLLPAIVDAVPDIKEEVAVLLSKCEGDACC